jgi:hypothetical protein
MLRTVRLVVTGDEPASADALGQIASPGAAAGPTLDLRDDAAPVVVTDGSSTRPAPDTTHDAARS